MKLAFSPPPMPIDANRPPPPPSSSGEATKVRFSTFTSEKAKEAMNIAESRGRQVEEVGFGEMIWRGGINFIVGVVRDCFKKRGGDKEE